MNNSYFSPAINHYSTSYDYSYEYSSPSTYFNSPLLPTPCPVHSPYNFYTSLPMNLSPFSHNYYQHEQQSQVYPTPPVQQQPIILPGADRTPLRRHKCFKKNELQILYQVYVRDTHPSTDVLQQLADQLNVSIDKVRQWFKNRRHSDKHKKREIPTAQS